MEEQLTGEVILVPGTYLYTLEVIRCEPCNEKCDVHPYIKIDYGPSRIHIHVQIIFSI